VSVGLEGKSAGIRYVRENKFHASDICFGDANGCG